MQGKQRRWTSSVTGDTVRDSNYFHLLVHSRPPHILVLSRARFLHRLQAYTVPSPWLNDYAILLLYFRRRTVKKGGWGEKKEYRFFMAPHLSHKSLGRLQRPTNVRIHHTHKRVPGEIKRSRDLRGGRWSWTLTFAQKRSWVGRWSWAEQVGRLLLRVVQVVHQQRCNGHCLSNFVQHSSWKSNCTVHKSLGNGEGTPP